MSNYRFFKTKYFLTISLCAILSAVYMGSLIIDQINYSKLEGEYNDCFLDVTENFEKVYFNSMSSKEEINDDINDLNLNNEVAIRKIKILKDILAEMGSFSHGRRERNSLTSYYRYVDVQNYLEQLLEFEKKYSNAQSELSEKDTEDITRAYTQIRIFRDLV